MLGPILLLGAVSLVISWVLTYAMIRIAPRLGFVDRPGGRKIHADAKPLGGGVAIFLAFALPMLLALWVVPTLPPSPDSPMAQSTPARLRRRASEGSPSPDADGADIPGGHARPARFGPAGRPKGSRAVSKAPGAGCGDGCACDSIPSDARCRHSGRLFPSS